MQLSNFWRHTSLLNLWICALVAGISACSSSDDTSVSTKPALPAIESEDIAGRVTVSGVSSGGYMAVQAHIALSDRISGAAAVSAGPYHCADASVTTALGPCMKGDGLTIERLLEFVRQQSTLETIANITHLADSRAWVFHSPDDVVVSPKVGQALSDFYTALLPEDNVAYITSTKTAHGWPTLSNGAPCTQMAGDFINACNFDAAGTVEVPLR